MWFEAFNMIHHTTKGGVCTVLHLSFSRWFRTSDHQLWYHRLLHNLYSDTLFAPTVSSRGNTCVQIFATNFGWICSFPMKLKSEAHEELSLPFQWDGVPPALICDNAKEMVLGEFNIKHKEAQCHLKQMKPFTPWFKSAKREKKELKKGLVGTSLSLSLQRDFGMTDLT